MSRDQTKSLFAADKPEPTGCNHIIRVAFESAVDAEFDYAVDDELWPIQVGQRVQAPFGRQNKLEVGFCVSADIPLNKSFAGHAKGRSLKQVAKVIDRDPLLDSQLMELARWISSYYVCPSGQVLAAMIPAGVKKGAGARTERQIYLAITPADLEKTIQGLRGRKQKEIILFLQEHKAFRLDSAFEVQALLQAVGCGGEPVKRLAEKQMVRIAERTVLKSLPAIPKGMVMPAQKVTLNKDQKEALAHFITAIDSEKFGVTLLHGVTDSGKTELYIRAIEAVVRKRRTAVVLLPEIALTTQTIQRFGARFERIAVMHSALTASQRNAQWHKIKAGEADVVIGARSAIFAPLPRLGLIVVDEEHEPSYKQDTAPRYNGRDVAIKRAQLADAYCILGSATPALETLFNSQSRMHFSLVRLPKRVMDLPMPEMKLVDLRKAYSTHKGVSLISELLAERLKETIARKEQAILLLNRRGYSNFVFCPSCKHTLHCRNCDVTLTFHKSKSPAGGPIQTITGKHFDYGYAVCHYCMAQTLVPEKCPLCGKRMAMIGLGSQRLEEELARKFPDARVSRVDSDSMTGRDYYAVLKGFSDGRIDILAGTQMLAKGLHFPNVTLVGIISADTSLYLPDFRANERTFQLISQVAGRAGRSTKKGAVFVQTYLPDQPAIQFALKNDYAGFVNEELKHRKACNLPPFWRLAAIIARDKNFDKLEAACGRLRESIASIVERDNLDAIIRGPVPAVISRIQQFHRMQIIIRAPKADTINRLVTSLRTLGPTRPAVKVAIDIDPVNLL
ncbi:MAG: replication restart helicase PriA [Planctomycetota bacterium]|jgi:primosomal protein N' (replication factor Y)